MSKTKRSPQKKSGGPPEDKEDKLAQKLCDLAIEIAEQEDPRLLGKPMDEEKNDFRKTIRKCLFQKKEEVLLDALERTAWADNGAYRLLKEHIEEASGVLIERDANGNMLEANAFAIPVFAQTTGGLDREQSFQDEEAFERLVQSIKDAGLESRNAKVVLVSHAYHVDEFNRIGYTQLNEMVHDAYASMTRRKMAATPAIERSITGWPDKPFAPEDRAVELRFLLGFALKAVDDPFYQVPEDEDAADAWFEAREERFRRWAGQAAPLVKRCLVRAGREIELNFLYQDLFHGAKDRGIAEYAMLQMMSDLNHDMEAAGVALENVTAVIGPAETDDDAALRVNLYAADGTLIATSDKPMDAVRDLETEAADIFDALQTMGVKSLALAQGFDADGAAVDTRPYRA